MQYASKHYGTSLLIQTRKNPVKQRSDRKKFKAQRNRKKIYKRMSFDYDDFLYKSKNENYKRIQTRPTISYCNTTNINSIFTDYYYEKLDHQQTETLLNDIPIWQCNACTYINIEKLQFCAICNNPFKYDYDNHGFNNNTFYTIKYTKHKKHKKHKKQKKNCRAISIIKNKQKNDFAAFKSYWNDMTKSQNEYKQYKMKINLKLKNCKEKIINNNNYQLIIVLSLEYFTSSICLNYKQYQSIYARIVPQNQYMDLFMFTTISHYHPFYEIPCYIDSKLYKHLSKNKKSFQYDLSFIEWKIKKQIQPQLFRRNDLLEQMIDNHRKRIIIENNPLEFSKLFRPATPVENKIIKDESFNVEIDILLNKTMINSHATDNFSEYNKNVSSLIKCIKQERYLVQEINVKTSTDSYQLILTNGYDRNVSIFTLLFEEHMPSFPLASTYDLSNKTIIKVAKKCVDILFGDELDDGDIISDSSSDSSSECVNLFHDEDSSDDSSDDTSDDSSDDNSNYNDIINYRQFNFAEKHIPYYNLLPLSFKISRIVYEYIPSMDIINNIFVPMIGYNKIYYVTINTNVRNPRKSYFRKIKRDNETESKTEKMPVSNEKETLFLPAYATLIEMGFEGNVCLQAAKKHPHNIGAAIDWITNPVNIGREKAKYVKYNYDKNWDAIALYEEEESSLASAHLFGADDSSSDYSSSD